MGRARRRIDWGLEGQRLTCIQVHLCCMRGAFKCGWSMTIGSSISRNRPEGAFCSQHESRTRHKIIVKRSKLKGYKKIHPGRIGEAFDLTLRLGITIRGGVTIKVVTAALQHSR